MGRSWKNVFAAATAIAASFGGECKVGVRLLPLTSRHGRDVLFTSQGCFKQAA